MSKSTMQNNPRAKSVFFPFRRFIPVAGVLSIATCQMVASSPVAAQVTDTWASTTSGNWSVAGNWNNGAPPSAATTSLIFNSSASGYTATNDIANPFLLNALTLNTSVSNGAIALAGNSLTLIQNGSTQPVINVTGTGTALISSLVNLGNGSTSSVTINNTGSLTLTGGTSVTNLASPNYTANAILNLDGTGTTTLSGSGTSYNPDQLTVGGTGGSAKVIVTSTGSQVQFQPYNTYIGGTYSGGAAGNNSTLTLTGNVFMSGGGQIALYNGSTFNVGSTTGSDIVIVNMSSLTDGGTSPTGSTIHVATGSILQFASTASGQTYYTTTYSGSLTGGGEFKIGDTTSGVTTNNLNQILAGSASGFTGSFVIEGPSEITAASTSALPTNGTVNVENAASILNLNGFSNSVAGITGSGSVTLGSGTLTVTNGSGLSFAGAITGTGGVTKTGTGIQTLSGSNGYTGTTAVSGGVLSITGTTNSGTTSVTSGGTLAGTGTVGAVTLSSGGAIAPGNGAVGSIGTLSASSLVVNSGAVFTYDLNLGSTSSDKLSVSGVLSKSSASSTGFSFAFSTIGTVVGSETYTLASFTAPSNTALEIIGSDLSYSGLPSGDTGTFVTNTGLPSGFWTGLFIVNSSSTPEPGSLALLGIGLAPFGFAIRKRITRKS